MNTYQELEVKFYVSDLRALAARLEELGAALDGERVLEVNLRFDTEDGDLSRAMQVLRLRQDRIARLTFKGPDYEQEGARLRQEIEFAVSDFDAAQAFLEALGYRVTFSYEKYRTTYHLQGVEILLDELPYGNFVELEGPDAATIRPLSNALGLDWSRRVPEGYTVLFQRLRSTLALPFRDLTFANFAGRQLYPDELGVRPADVRT